MYTSVKRAALALLCFAGFPAAYPSHGQAQDLQALLERARAAQGSGQYAEAATLYHRAAVLSPRTAELWSNLGVMQFFAGQLDPSALSLQHALQLKPDLFVSLLFLGKVYVQQNKPAQALPFLQHAKTLQPRDPETLLSLGKVYADLHRGGDAASTFRDATQAAPQDAEAWLGLGSSAMEVIAADGRVLASSAPKSVWARALYADDLLAQGRPLEATDTYTAVLASAMPAERRVLTRTLAFMRYNPSQFSLPANSQAALEHLVDQTSQAQISQAQTANEQVSDSSTKSRAATVQESTRLALIEGAARAFWVKNYAGSAAQAQGALRLNPNDAEALYWSVKANERLAVAALSEVDDLAPNSPTNHDLVGDLYRYQRQPENALVEYEKALALDPRDAAALLGATASYLAGSQYAEATATAQRALADKPLDPQLNLLMAEIFAAQRRESEAKPYLAKCLNIAPEFQPRVHILLARAAAEEGNLQEAIRQFELALPGDEDGSTHYQLSRLYRRTGDLAKAQAAESQAKALVTRRDARATVVVREATAP